ncbi:MAG: hypothetical protein HC788_01775 [Sphingopyxis sp.]|nr:hypothetical protein [Sphingopyxis sp.]
MIKPGWLILSSLLLAACGKAGDFGANANNPLEAAARDRGIVQEGHAAPTGVFERRHELGRDALCVVPAAGGDYRFALTAAYGAGSVCQASGTLSNMDGAWTMQFADRTECSFTVREVGDELRLPGSLPSACAKLCRNGGSISGLRLPRASWSEQDAVTARFDRPDGKPGVDCRG